MNSLYRKNLQIINKNLFEPLEELERLDIIFIGQYE